MTTADEFKAGLLGQLLRPGDDAYDGARKVWNGRMIAVQLSCACAGAGDVIPAVNFARDNGLRAAVRGGGHNVPGHARLRRGPGARPLCHEGHPYRSRCIARPGPNPESGGASSIPRPKPSGWPRPASTSAIRASPASPSVAALAGGPQVRPGR